MFFFLTIYIYMYIIKLLKIKYINFQTQVLCHL